MFRNRNKSEFSEKRVIIPTYPHFSYSICRPKKRNADSKVLISTCPTPNTNHLPDYADKSAIANYLIIEDVSDKEDTRTPEKNTNHLPDQYADKYAIDSDLFIEDV